VVLGIPPDLLASPVQFERMVRRQRVLKNPKVYVAGGMTQATNSIDRTLLYRSIARVCRQFGYEVCIPYLIREESASCPGRFSPREIYEWDLNHLATSDLLIAYVGVPAIGVGIELGLAACYRIPVITMAEWHAKVSPMVLGHPRHFVHIDFETEGDCTEALAAELSALRRVPYFEPISTSNR
jgi:nucleoside 2-deoxyribosyltransferase